MNRSILRFAAAASLAAGGALLPSLAIAQSLLDGVYVRGAGGVSALLDDTAAFKGGGPRSGVDFDTGYAVGIAVGYDFTPNISAEVEYMYRSSDISSFDRAGFGGGGDFASVVISAHLLYRFDGWEATENTRLRPFIGVGLGVAQEVDLDISRGPAAGEYEDSGALAFQARGGLEWTLSPSVSLGVEARYLNMGSLSLDPDGPGRDLKAKYETIDGLVSLAYRF